MTDIDNTKLRERFNPDGSLLRQQQLRMLEMLKYIDGICKKHNIKYWLSSGTLLGAVRHQGFIPWDDDLDIEMLKEDYRKFIKCMQMEKSDRYILQTHDTDSNYFAPYAKLRDLYSNLKETNTNDLYYKYHGIYIDIFCLEPSSSRFLTKLSAYMQNRLLYDFNELNNAFIRKIWFGSFFLILYKILYPCLSMISRIDHRGQLRHVHGSCFSCPRDMKDIFPLNKLFFEDDYFPVPHNCDNYLTIMYGKYMNLPDLNLIEKHLTKIDIYDE